MDRQLETTTLKQFSGKHLKELLLKLLVKNFGSISPRVGLFQVPQKALPMLKILEVRFEDAARGDRTERRGPGSIDSIVRWRHGT